MLLLLRGLIQTKDFSNLAKLKEKSFCTYIASTMTRKMTRSGASKHSSDVLYLDDIESIELQADHHDQLGLPNSIRFHESESTQRLLLPRDATPSESISSSGCKLFLNIDITSQLIFRILILSLNCFIPRILIVELRLY